jgi:hypothetical protein
MGRRVKREGKKTKDFYAGIKKGKNYSGIILGQKFALTNAKSRKNKNKIGLANGAF